MNDDAQTLKIREAYKQFIVKLLMLSGYKKADAERMRDNVMGIEMELAKVAMTRTEQRDYMAQYNTALSQKLKNFAPTLIGSSI